jgi:hypothetical protein
MDEATKTSKLDQLTVRERKAAALDARVKQEITSQHADMLSDMARLKALRLARDAKAAIITTVKQKARGAGRG